MKKNRLSEKTKKNNPLDCNGNPIDPKRKYIGNKFKIPMVSPDCSIYKNNSTIILFGGNGQQKPEQTPKSKFEEFLSGAPISFDQNEEV